MRIHQAYLYSSSFAKISIFDFSFGGADTGRFAGFVNFTIPVEWGFFIWNMGEIITRVKDLGWLQNHHVCSIRQDMHHGSHKAKHEEHQSSLPTIAVGFYKVTS